MLRFHHLVYFIQNSPHRVGLGKRRFTFNSSKAAIHLTHLKLEMSQNAATFLSNLINIIANCICLELKSESKLNHDEFGFIITENQQQNFIAICSR